MNKSSRNIRHDSASRHGLSGRQASHCCPHCSKQYTTSTWLDNHIKTKHSAGDTQGWSQSLADMFHNRRRIANSAKLLSQSSVSQELYHLSLVRDLHAMSSSLKSFIPLIDDLVALLQEPDEISSRAHSISQNHPRNLKRRASSRDVHEQNKRQGTSTSASDLPLPRTNDLMYWDGFESQDASPATSVGEGDPYGFDSSEHALGFAQYPSFEQVKDFHLPFSPQPTLSSQAPASEFPQRQCKSRPSRAPKTQSLTGNATQMFQTFLRRQQGRISPCEQLDTYPHGTLPAPIAQGWVQPESKQHLTHTPLQKSLDLPSHELGQHPSPSEALQQSLDYFGPASQYDIGDAFSQTPQQNDYENGLGLDRSDFFTLPIQHEKALREEDRLTPLRS